MEPFAQSESELTSYSESYIQYPSNEDRDIPSLAQGERLRYLTLATLLIVLPLCFGGAHLLTTALFGSLAFGTLLYSILTNHGILDRGLPPGSARRGVALCLLALIGISTGTTFIRTALKEPHPLFSETSISGTGELAYQAIFSMGAFFAIYVIACLYASRSIVHASRLKNLVIAGGCVAASVALLHWFYDNGKLFWIFQANYTESGARARWPFVNPNHLGHFLLPLFFLVFARTVQSIADVFDALEKDHLVSKKNPLPAILASRAINRAVRSVMMHSTIAILAGVAIAGSLSRGAWGGACVGLGVFILFSWKYHRRQSSSALTPPLLRRRHRSRHSQSETESTWLRRVVALRKLSRPLLALAAAALVLFFLNERGRELLETRIEYGLSHSKDDIRWVLLGDTLSMIRDHPWGVGLGGWGETYPAYMSSSLAGINPVYLHSDPIQLLAELGVIGVLPVVAIAVVLVLGTLSAMQHSTEHPRTSRALKTLFSIIAALATASFLDFPFRMFAYSALSAVLLATTSFYIDSLRSRHYPE